LSSTFFKVFVGYWLYYGYIGCEGDEGAREGSIYSDWMDEGLCWQWL